MAALAAAETIGQVVVAAPPGFEDEMRELVDERTLVVTGGASRAASVALAMESVDTDLVAIHDAARPLLTADLVDRLIRRLIESGAEGVIAAAPVVDTLKREGDNGAVLETVARAGLWGAQTPQAFGTEALRAAQRAAQDAGELATATDEAWLIERGGGTILLEATGAPNPKVTDRVDLELAAAMLRRFDG